MFRKFTRTTKQATCYTAGSVFVEAAKNLSDFQERKGEKKRLQLLYSVYCVAPIKNKGREGVEAGER